MKKKGSTTTLDDWLAQINCNRPKKALFFLQREFISTAIANEIKEFTPPYFRKSKADIFF